MHQTRELLEAADNLTEKEKELLVKLIWLFGQVSDEQQVAASKRVDAYLNHDQPEWDDFMREVRTVVLDLELAVAAKLPDS